MNPEVLKKIQTVSLKDLWCRLMNEKLIHVSYSGFIYWAQQAGIPYKHGLTAADQNKLQKYAIHRHNVKSKTSHRVTSKSAYIRELQDLCDDEGKVSGDDAIMMAELYRVCDRSTIYRRAKQKGMQFSTKYRYKVSKILEVVFNCESAD